MIPFRGVALALAVASVTPRATDAARLLPSPTFAPLMAPLVLAQQQDIPDVVRLLAQRAVRAERRGDMDTANALYEIIRDMGFVVRRPSMQEASPRDNGGSADASDDRNAGRRDSDDDDDGDSDDDGDDDGGDDGDSDDGDDGRDGDGGDDGGGDD